jgi:hypothetical protein
LVKGVLYQTICSIRDHLATLKALQRIRSRQIYIQCQCEQIDPHSPNRQSNQKLGDKNPDGGAASDLTSKDHRPKNSLAFINFPIMSLTSQQIGESLTIAINKYPQALGQII